MKKGFTLLFAVLISSLLLSIGIAILDLTLKEFLLSSAGRESQFAFYAADDAMECALYWDHNIPGGISGSSFATSTATELTVNPADLKCNGIQLANYVSAPDVTSAVTSFDVSYAVPTEEDVNVRPCAKIVITKTSSSTPDGIATATQIESRGYDTCDTSNPHQTERGIQSNY